MKIYLVRHAAAIESSPELADSMRYLTPEGRALFRKTARTVLKNGIEPGIILTSPLLRAVQTADILAETLLYNGQVLIRDELKPGFDMYALNSILDDFRSADELVLVGHEPDLSSLICTILSQQSLVNLKKGAVIKIKIDLADISSPGTFKWIAHGKKLITNQDEVFKTVAK